MIHGTSKFFVLLCFYKGYTFHVRTYASIDDIGTAGYALFLMSIFSVLSGFRSLFYNERLNS
jgi:hypothetical protein